MDITKKIEALSGDLESLIQKAEIWRLLFDECPFAIAVFDAQRRFFLVNDEFCTLTNFTREEIISEQLVSVIPIELRKMHRIKEKEYALNPRKRLSQHGLSAVMLTKQRKEISVSIDLSYINYDNKVYYVAFIKRI